MAARSFWYRLGAITCVAWIVRVFYVWNWRKDPVAVAVTGANDSAYYHHASRLLADGEGFLNPFFSASGIPYQSADHPPLYQLFLAGFAKLGLDSSTQQLLLTTTFIGTPTVWFTGLAGRSLLSPTTGLLAAALAAVAPNVFSWDGMLLSEPSAMLFVTITIWAAYRYWHTPTTRGAVGLGASAAAAAMCRAELVLLLVLLVLPLVVRHGLADWPARLRRLAAAGLAALVIIGPWVGYNLTRFEDPVYLSVGAEITMASATGDDTYYGPGTGYWSFFAACAIRDRIRDEHPPKFVVDRGELRAVTPTDLAERSACDNNPDYRELPVLDQSQEAPFFGEYVGDYVGEHLDRLPVVVIARVGRVFYLWNPSHVVRADWSLEGRERWVTHLGWWTFYPLAGLALIGSRHLRRAGVPLYPTAAVFVTVLAATVLAFGTPRYRASAETALCLLAAVGIVALRDRFRRPEEAPAPPVA